MVYKSAKVKAILILGDEGKTLKVEDHLWVRPEVYYSKLPNMVPCILELKEGVFSHPKIRIHIPRDEFIAIHQNMLKHKMINNPDDAGILKKKK